MQATEFLFEQALFLVLLELGLGVLGLLQRLRTQLGRSAKVPTKVQVQMWTYLLELDTRRLTRGEKYKVIAGGHEPSI